MAELLLYFKPAEVDPTAPNDPVRRFGDIVHVLPDGSTWGTSECLDDFLVIRVEGLAYEVALPYTAPLLREALVEGLPGVEIAAPNRYAVDMAALDYDDVAQAYASDWYVPVVQAAEFQAALKDKASGDGN